MGLGVGDVDITTIIIISMINIIVIVIVISSIYCQPYWCWLQCFTLGAQEGKWDMWNVGLQRKNIISKNISRSNLFLKILSLNKSAFEISCPSIPKIVKSIICLEILEF